MGEQKRNHTKKRKEYLNEKETKVETPTLSSEELWSVLNFADNYYKTSISHTGVYTPYVTNNLLSEIGLSSNKISENDLKNAFKDPINHQNELIGYSEWLKFTDTIAKRTLEYKGNLLAWDWTYSCINIDTKKDYLSKEYKEDYRVFKNFMARFNPKAEFSKANRRSMDIDTYYTVFRMDGNNYEFQELPHRYCKITGKNMDWGYLFDFDMNWFLRMGLSIDQYPPVFKKMYNDVFTSKNINDYNPSNRLTERDGTWSLWTQTSPLPEDGGFTCFKYNSDIYASIPYLTSLFADAINRPLLRELQTNQYIIASQKILLGLIPLLNKQQSGQVKDALAVSPEIAGQFLGVLKQGLSDAIKISGVPFSDVKDINFPLPEKNMYNEYNAIQAGNSGVTSRMIYATDKMTAKEVDYSINIDEIITEQVYPQYERWISSMINSLTKKYKFSIKFEGTNLRVNREYRQKVAREYATLGFLLPQKFAAAIGMNIFELENQLQITETTNFMDMLMLPPNANTMSMGGNVGGRPKVETTEADRESDDYE